MFCKKSIARGAKSTPNANLQQRAHARREGDRPEWAAFQLLLSGGSVPSPTAHASRNHFFSACTCLANVESARDEKNLCRAHGEAGQRRRLPWVSWLNYGTVRSMQAVNFAPPNPPIPSPGLAEARISQQRRRYGARAAGVGSGALAGSPA